MSERERERERTDTHTVSERERTDIWPASVNIVNQQKPKDVQIKGIVLFSQCRLARPHPPITDVDVRLMLTSIKVPRLIERNGLLEEICFF